MSRMKNKDDLVQYCIRLNLNNPEHLEVHKILQGLNKEIHHSQNNFIIQSVLRNAKCYSVEEMMTEAAKEEADNGKCITHSELNEIIERIKEEIANDVLSKLVVSLVSKDSNAVQNTVNTNVVNEAPEDIESDPTLVDLSKIWA